MADKWLEWSKKLQAISQTGLAYSKDPYDLDRFNQIASIAYEILSTASGLPVNQVKELFTSDSGYATPKVDLRAGIFKDNRVLLVKEAMDGNWTLPGGWADVCESPRAGVEREVLEESGFEVEVIKCVAIIDRSLHDYKPPYPHHLYKMFFLCALKGGVAKASIETTEVGFFDLTSLPNLSEARVLKKDIDRLFDHYLDPKLPTHFD